MDMSQYLQIFIEESNDNLQSLNEQLLKLEHSPADSQILNEIFRVAHTLKGMAGTMGFTRMQQLTHHVENVLSEIRNGVLTVTAEMLDILFQCLDALENYVSEITNTGSEGEEAYTHLLEQLEKIGNQATGVQPVKEEVKVEMKEEKSTLELTDDQKHIVGEALKQGLFCYEVKVSLASTCVLKAARAFVVFRDMEEHGDIIHSVPQSNDIEDEKFDQDFTIVVVTDQEEDAVKAKVFSVSEVEEVVIKHVIPEENIEEQTPVTQEIKEEVKVPTTPVVSGPQNAPAVDNKAHAAAKSVRVNIERLDTLMNLVSELIIVKTQLEGIKNSDERQNDNYNDSVEYLERVTSSLHDAVMKVRMVPIETVFNRFPRMLRDVSRKLNKEIELVMSGEETELDRTVSDEIGDPLIHLLRNAADHGLETTEERIELGKNPKGTIKLQAYQDGNNVIIEVEDDGKGIDTQKILEKSISKGVVTQEEGNTLSEQEILELLFKPGFSTAEVTTDLSGRGVGLDVVKSKITTLGGSVEIVTEKGKGSKFIVRLPLTLAIIQALMVQIGEEKYAIPLNNIQNIENIQKEEIRYVQKQEVIVLREQVIPIVRLHDLLDIPNEEKDLMMVVIVKKGEKHIGFVIDALIGQHEIVIKPLGKYLSHINMIAGATILGNGEVALILDVSTLV